MFESLLNAFRAPDIRRRILFVLGILVIFRFMAHVPVPGVDRTALAEFFGVRTAWHGPGDVSPVGHAANLQLDLSTSNFGIQEAYLFPERTREVFPGTPEIRDGSESSPGGIGCAASSIARG